MKKIILLAMLFATMTFGQSSFYLLFDDDYLAGSYQLLFPDTIYAVEGQEIEVYFDNLGINLPHKAQREIVGLTGTETDSAWRYIPSGVSEDNLSIIFGNRDTLTTMVKTVAISDTLGTGITLLGIGDSRTDGGLYLAQLKVLTGDSLTLLGTQSDGGINHEGYGGKTFYWFESNVASPFVYAGNINFTQYLIDNGYSAPDYVVIRLGTNDVFALTDANMDANINQILGFADSLLLSIHAAGANTQIGICMETPPANEATFLDTYPTSSYSQYKKNIHRFNELLKTKYGAGGTGELSYVTLIPLYLNSDKNYDFYNGVHENGDGYKLNAVPIYGWLMNKYRASKVLYALDLDGSTEILLKTSPINLALNGNERILNTINSTMEIGSELVTNGTFTSNVTSWTGDRDARFWYNTDWNEVGMTNCLLDSATSTVSVDVAQNPPTIAWTAGRHKLTYKYYIPSSNTTTTKLRTYIGTPSFWGTIQSTIDTWTTASEYLTPTDATYLRFYFIDAANATNNVTVGDKIYLDDVSIKRVPDYIANGSYTIDTTSQHKYAGSYSLIATTGGGSSGTKPRIVSVIGNQSFLSDTISIIIDSWEQVAWNFQANAEMVGQAFKLYIDGVGDSTVNYISLAPSNFTPLVAGEKYTLQFRVWAVGTDSFYIDAVSLTQNFDLLVNIWAKFKSGTGYILSTGGVVGMGYSIGITSTYAILYISDGVTNIYRSKVATVDTNWHMITVSLDKINGGYVYLDGNVSSVLSLSALGSITQTNFYIGGYMGSPGINGQIGQIQMVRFADIANNNHSVEYIYGLGQNVFNMPSNYAGGTIVGWWLWSGETDTAMKTDHSSSSNDVTSATVTIDDRVTITAPIE